MTTTLQQFRDDLRDHCGVDNIEWDDPTADRLLDRSFWEIADLYDFRAKEATEDISTVAGTNAYNLPADKEQIESILIKDINSEEWSPIVFMIDRDLQGRISDRVDSEAEPTNYEIRNNQIIVYPTPQYVYQLRIRYKKTLGDIISSGSGLPSAWDEVILFGAIWRGYAKLGDWNRRQSAKAAQVELIQPKKPEKVKELEDTPMAGLQVPRRAYR